MLRTPSPSWECDATEWYGECLRCWWLNAHPERFCSSCPPSSAISGGELFLFSTICRIRKTRAQRIAIRDINQLSNLLCQFGSKGVVVQSPSPIVVGTRRNIHAAAGIKSEPVLH